jgi:subtilisin family serine protease
MNKKLAPELRSRLRSAQSRDSTAAARFGRLDRVVGERVGIIVECTGNVDDLTAVGFIRHSLVQHPTKGYKISTGTILIDRLDDLATIEHVVDVEGPRRMYPELNYSLPEIHATAVHTGARSRKGDGIVIGIIDSGIDWRHGSFVNADGTSRILTIWDQILEAQPGDTVGPNGDGVVYTQDQISRALNRNASVTVPVRTKDVDTKEKRDGHGTHVAGIAAGNGRPATCCRGPHTYVGVAPNAELIVVRYDDRGEQEIGENQHLVEAIDYIIRFPPTRDSPKVINISQGDNLGPHDGTSAVERAIDAHVAEGDRLQLPRIVVKSAGNEGEMLRHVHGMVPGNNSIDIEFTVPKEITSDALLDLWYDRAGTLNLTVTAQGGANSGVVGHGTDLPANAAAPPFIANPTAVLNRQSQVTIDGTINGQHNRDNNFRITIHSPTHKHGTLPDGAWKLNLANPNAAAVNFHCWIERGTNTPRFLPPLSPADGKVRATLNSTLSIPGTAEQVIAVANHEARTDCCDCRPSTGIVSSSSRGPVAKGPPTNQKPEIAAPGLEITSAKADVANFRGNCCSCCPDACCCLYEDLTGTSMAAPHVTGAIALLLEENPRLTRADIVRHLQATARDKPAGGWDTTWGGGKLNIEAALAAVRAGAGGGGAGGGGPHMPPPFFLQESAFSGRRASDFDPLSSSTNSFSRDQVSDSEMAAEPFASWLQILRARLKAFPEGEHVAAVISRHFSEVRRLINSNRRIATMWHRANGPLLLRRLLHGSRAGDWPLSTEEESVCRYLDRCFDLLAHYGSPRLRGSLERYRALVAMLLKVSMAAPIESRVTERI